MLDQNNWYLCLDARVVRDDLCIDADVVHCGLLSSRMPRTMKTIPNKNSALASHLQLPEVKQDHGFVA